MKLKSRLTIGFLAVILVPLVLISISVYLLGNYQISIMQRIYELSDQGSSIISNQAQILNKLTKEDYNEIKHMALESPAKFQDLEYLTKLEEKLSHKYSFLLVRMGSEFVFGNSVIIDKIYESLPRFGQYNTELDNGLYIGGEGSYLVKQQDFYFEDGSEGTVFVATDVNIVVPQVKSLVIQLAIAAINVMILTSCIITFWIYRGIVKPLGHLREATNKIKYGDLDFSIEQGGEDEIGQLCSDFEDMRRRLKEYTEDREQVELENKELISNISHDLKTPITAIKGYVEGIMDGVADTPQKMDKYLKTIYTKANEMTSLIEELSIYSKIDTNNIPYNFSKLNLDGYFRDCIEDVGLDLESKNIDIAYFNYADKALNVIADSEQLRRVVNNIINNSVKYIGKKKGIINVRISDNDEYVRIEIEDNGKGIAEKDLSFIFERFYRTDASRNSTQGGSGLGLAISKKIIEEHGGKIWAASKEGTGTIIYFTLKKHKEEVNNEQNISG